MAVDYKKMTSAELGKLLSGNDQQAAQELTARGGLVDGKLQTGWQNLQPTAQQTPQTPAQTPESIIQQIQQQKIEKAKQAMLAGIQAQREQSQAASQSERQALQQSAMQQRGRIGVEDVMSRRARENVLAQGGLAASGARGQGEIAQNVITQGALGQNRAQEQQGLLDIGRRQSEYEARLNQQALEAQTQAELQGLDYRLQDLYSQQQADREQAALESERAFTLSRDEADRQFTLARDEAQTLSQRERDLLQADIQREQTLLDAEIQRARDSKNFEREQQLMRQKQANDIQLEGIRTANDIRLEGVKQQNRLDLEGGAGSKIKIGDAQAALDNAIRLVPTETTQTNILGNKIKTDIPGYQLNQKQAAALELVKLVQNDLINETMETQLMARYGLTEDDIDNAIIKLIPTSGK